MLYQMLFISNDVVMVLEKLFENFDKNILTTVEGENVVFSIKHI